MSVTEERHQCLLACNHARLFTEQESRAAAGKPRDSTAALFGFIPWHDGIPSTSLQDVFRATVVAKVTYCTPAWSGTCSASDRARLDSFLNRCKRLGFADTDMSSITELFSDVDDAFFERIMTNSEHVLQPFLPEKPDLSSESVLTIDH